MSININPVFELLRNDGSIVVNKALMHRIGVNETIIYAELVSRYAYFSKEDMLTHDLYFYNTVDDLQLATALGEKAQNSAIKNLISVGLIDKKLKGTPARRHFKVIDNMQLILTLIEEGKTVIQELDKKQKQRMKQKIQYSKLSSSQKTEVENTRNDISNSSSDNMKELSKINTSDNTQEVVENVSVLSKSSVKFLQEEGYSSVQMKEQLPAQSRINNTNIIIQNNNTKNNREGIEATPISIPDNTYQEILWSNFTRVIKQQLSEVSYNTWIKSLVLVEIKHNELILKAPNDFTKGIFESRYKAMSLKAITVNNPEINDIKVIIP